MNARPDRPTASSILPPRREPSPMTFADALSAMARAPFCRNSFARDFAAATGLGAATLEKLKTGGWNRSPLRDGILLAGRFWAAAAEPGEAAMRLRGMQGSLDRDPGLRKTAPSIVVASDGALVAAWHPATDETCFFAFADLGRNFEFLLPAMGRDRLPIVAGNPADARAATRIARLHAALLAANPDWRHGAARQALDRFVVRLVLVLFLQSSGAIAGDRVTRLLAACSPQRPSEAGEMLSQLLAALATPRDGRAELPDWTRELPEAGVGFFDRKLRIPAFDAVALHVLRDACRFDWTAIDPQVFGSLLQSLASSDLRADMGMHYTSPGNILKLLGPLLLDGIDEALQAAWNSPSALRRLLARLSGIRLLDPACGSGNFLVVAYRELRDREVRILGRLAALGGARKTPPVSRIRLGNFRGIEIAGFAAETARVALMIAACQADARFVVAFGGTGPTAPSVPRIVHGNALRLDWNRICPAPLRRGETFIAGNPPFRGFKYQSRAQKADLASVFRGELKSYAGLDLVTAWLFKASRHVRGRRAAAAFVLTNSACQGRSVPMLWPHVLKDGIEIGFARPNFPWSNEAAANATVTCSIVGLRNASDEPKFLFDGELRRPVRHVNAYLLDAPEVIVASRRTSLFGLPAMTLGSIPYDAGNLILTPAEKREAAAADPRITRYLRILMGSQEVVRGTRRYGLLIPDDELEDALAISEIARRVDRVRAFRLASSDAGTRALAARPHRFREHAASIRHAFLVPRVTSENRPYLPVDWVGPDVISTDRNMVLHDAPDWCLALVASRMHRVWIDAVCAKLEMRFSYSSALGWNTFPVPALSERAREALSGTARRILRARYNHWPASIADLYAPDAMPRDLAEAHRHNDEFLETLYAGRPFRSDAERLDHLFQRYARAVALPAPALHHAKKDD
ncbi:lactate dehydrogenase [Cereibacter sphaeroides]|uniref:DNA methyltransferase n=1 Tax=Cereibacter sphaeroides TaxID=1063 RepID=UPI001F363E03|nr:DNA methyltransferase [Cereibacter sphaeroides]MCE6957669.1 lactate dehydrogenase [Cereibacter sphaeroides]MCE6971411.1 lactate dehydrogenase [Cereibacter sphaeroides]